MSKKLGYTWYPKDWISSESVFELTLEQRGLYRELIDLAMLNDNKVKINLPVWSRRWNVEKDELMTMLNELQDLEMIQMSDETVFVPSCESRLVFVRSGSKGGSSSKGKGKGNDKGSGKGSSKGKGNQKKEKEKEKEKEKTNREDDDFTSELDELIEIFPDYLDDNFQTALKELIEVRKRKKASKSHLAMKRLITKIKKLSKGDLAVAVAIVNQSADGGWTDVYDLKAQPAPEEGGPTKTSITLD